MGEVALLAVLILAAAILYSSVGHPGASGYLAAMALVGVAPAMMKPTALALNILVATIATVRYYRAGYFICGLPSTVPWSESCYFCSASWRSRPPWASRSSATDSYTKARERQEVLEEVLQVLPVLWAGESTTPGPVA
jgi:hypothetical protein